LDETLGHSCGHRRQSANLGFRVLLHHEFEEVVGDVVFTTDFRSAAPESSSVTPRVRPAWAISQQCSLRLAKIVDHLLGLKYINQNCLLLVSTPSWRPQSSDLN
jgi:hypothetical protein